MSTMNIAKCMQEACTRKEKCLRWLLPSEGEYQTYALFNPEDCGFFIEDTDCDKKTDYL